jgi:hypothetical protein
MPGVLIKKIYTRNNAGKGIKGRENSLCVKEFFTRTKIAPNYLTMYYKTEDSEGERNVRFKQKGHFVRSKNGLRKRGNISGYL